MIDDATNHNILFFFFSFLFRPTYHVLLLPPLLQTRICIVFFLVFLYEYIVNKKNCDNCTCRYQDCESCRNPRRKKDDSLNRHCHPFCCFSFPQQEPRPCCTELWRLRPRGPGCHEHPTRWDAALTITTGVWGHQNLPPLAWTAVIWWETCTERDHCQD